MLPVVTKPLEFFHPDPTNPRKDFPQEDLRLLGESLRKKQLVPLLALKSGMIVDGERRWRAAKVIGLASLDVILLEDSVRPGEVKQMQLISTLQRADLKPWEQFCGFLDWLRENPGKGGKDLAAAIDRSEASVSMTLSLSRCAKVVQEAAAAGQIGLKDWHTISQAPEGEQQALLMAKLQGASVEGLRRLRRPSSGVRTARVKCSMSSGVVVTLAGAGDGMTLSEIIDTLAQLLKEAKRADEQGLDSKTFSAVLRDKAKAG
jgi:ParB family chromosome partitioning protein